MELGPEDVSLLERCPHFRGWYVQASMELRPKEICLHISQEDTELIYNLICFHVTFICT